MNGLHFRRGGHDVYRLGISFVLLSAISVLHFGTPAEHPELHNFFEHLYYVPVLLVAFWYGPLAGIGFAFLTSSIYLVHILKDLSDYSLLDPLVHLFLFNLMALIVGGLSAKAHRNLKHFKSVSADLERTNAELKETSEGLQRSERLAALGQLSAGIAHEIRNPLGAIKGAVEIISAELPTGHPKEEFVSIARQEVGRINKLIEEFLRFARPPEPKVSVVNVSELISSAVQLVESYSRRQNIQIYAACADRTSTIYVDENQMRQVLLNLLLNAVESMPNGGRLRITSREDVLTQTMTVEISDTGNGAECGDLDHIFDPFYTTKPHGTGLGLSIAHQLVRNHGGSLTARRNKGAGLTFTLLLPSIDSSKRCCSTQGEPTIVNSTRLKP